MTCQDVRDLVEPVATGDVAVDGAMRAHLETCPRCAAELASARRLEAALAGLSAPAAPAGFTLAVIGRIRRERWRSEERIDRLFNVAIGVAVLLLVAAVMTAANATGVLAAAGWTSTQIVALSNGVGRQLAPALATYVGAAGLLVTALGMWWWAERGLSL